MKQYGCIGKKLTHSFSKEIHARLADYKYELIELDEEEIKPFFTKKDFEAINVTIPYKQTVIPYLDSVSEIAQRKLVKLYNERISIYQATAHVVVPDMTTPEAEAEYILEKRMELIV